MENELWDGVFIDRRVDNSSNLGMNKVRISLPQIWQVHAIMQLVNSLLLSTYALHASKI